jgi:hypothetical protein
MSATCPASSCSRKFLQAAAAAAAAADDDDDDGDDEHRLEVVVSV